MLEPSIFRKFMTIYLALCEVSHKCTHAHTNAHMHVCMSTLAQCTWGVGNLHNQEKHWLGFLQREKSSQTITGWYIPLHWQEIGCAFPLTNPAMLVISVIKNIPTRIIKLVSGSYVSCTHGPDTRCHKSVRSHDLTPMPRWKGSGIKSDTCFIKPTSV